VCVCVCAPACAMVQVKVKVKQVCVPRLCVANTTRPVGHSPALATKSLRPATNAIAAVDPLLTSVGEWYWGLKRSLIHCMSSSTKASCSAAFTSSSGSCSSPEGQGTRTHVRSSAGGDERRRCLRGRGHPCHADPMPPVSACTARRGSTPGGHRARANS